MVGGESSICCLRRAKESAIVYVISDMWHRDSDTRDVQIIWNKCVWMASAWKKKRTNIIYSSTLDSRSRRMKLWEENRQYYFCTQLSIVQCHCFRTSPSIHVSYAKVCSNARALFLIDDDDDDDCDSIVPVHRMSVSSFRHTSYSRNTGVQCVQMYMNKTTVNALGKWQKANDALHDTNRILLRCPSQTAGIVRSCWQHTKTIFADECKMCMFTWRCFHDCIIASNSLHFDWRIDASNVHCIYSMYYIRFLSTWNAWNFSY